MTNCDEYLFMITLQQKFNFTFDFLYLVSEPGKIPEKYLPNVIFASQLSNDEYIACSDTSKINEIINTAPRKEKMHPVRPCIDACEMYNFFLLDNATINKVYYTTFDDRAQIIAIAYTLPSGKKVLSFSDLMYGGDINCAERIFINYIMPIVLKESVPLKKTVPMNEYVTALVRDKLEFTRKYYALKSQLEEIKKSAANSGDAVRFYKLATKFPAIVARLGWEPTPPDVKPGFVYKRRIVPNYALVDGTLYRLRVSNYHIDKITIVIEDILHIYAEGYHPNVGDAGNVCVGELTPYTRPTAENLLTLMTRLPEMLRTVNLDSAFHDYPDDYKLGDEVDVLNNGTGEFEVDEDY